MRAIFAIVLVLGMGLAGFAVYMARDYIQVYQSELDKERAARSQMVETVPVFVAKKPLRYGQTLNPEDVRQVRWPINAIPAGAFQDKDVLFPNDAAESSRRTVLRAMEKDEAIMALKVTRPGEDAGVSSRLAKGMRAFAIKVDVASGVSGFLRPGDRVDVYWTGQAVGSDGTGRGNITRLIQGGVQIIAVDQIADEDRNRPTIARTVTVEVTPQEVASLAQAQATGRLSLSLVGADDTETAGNFEADTRDVLGLGELQVVQTKKDRVCSVKTRKGEEIIETKVDCPETE